MSSIIFPIGWLYLSYNNVDPNTFLYGTWVRVGGHYLMGADPTTTMEHKTVGGNTGSWKPNTDSHTLTVDQMPRHTHSYRLTGQSTIESSTVNNHGKILGGASGNFWNTSFSVDEGEVIMSTGGGKGHSHVMPNYPAPTVFLNVWRRSA